jgi:hypothetical protein
MKRTGYRFVKYNIDKLAACVKVHSGPISADEELASIAYLQQKFVF